MKVPRCYSEGSLRRCFCETSEVNIEYLTVDAPFQQCPTAGGCRVTVTGENLVVYVPAGYSIENFFDLTIGETCETYAQIPQC